LIVDRPLRRKGSRVTSRSTPADHADVAVAVKVHVDEHDHVNVNVNVDVDVDDL
jgi:hypothetical protein